MSMKPLPSKKPVMYFFIFLFLFIIYLSFKIVQPFFNAILGSIILAYIFYPLQVKLQTKVKNKRIATTIIICLIILIVITPLFFIFYSLLSEYKGLFTTFNSSQTDLFLEKLKTLFNNDNLESYVTILFKEGINFLIGNLSRFLISLPGLLLEIFVMIFSLFYFLTDGPALLAEFKEVFPLKSSYKEKLFVEFGNITKAIVYGTLLIALIQGILGTIGLLIFKVPNPFIFGLVMMIFAMIPFLGPTFVWLPLSLYLFFIGKIGNAIGLFFYGLLIVSTVDNILKPKIISMKSKIHPLLVLLGLLGGLQIFGLVGLVIGPLVLSYLFIFLKFYTEEYADKT